MREIVTSIIVIIRKISTPKVKEVMKESKRPSGVHQLVLWIFRVVDRWLKKSNLWPSIIQSAVKTLMPSIHFIDFFGSRFAIRCWKFFLSENFWIKLREFDIVPKKFNTRIESTRKLFSNVLKFTVEIHPKYLHY